MFNKNTRGEIVYTSPPKNKPTNQRFRKIEFCLIALLAFILLSVPAFGQGTSASLSGSVFDASRGTLPGATVTALNTDTNLESRATANNAGIYNFPSLPTGTYIVTAQASGFQRSIITDVRLRAGTQSNLNFELAVMGTVTEVEVTASAETMILEAGSSTGAVLQEQLVTQLPVLTGSVLDLVQLMGGVVQPPATTISNPLFSANDATFAGVSAGNINITRDGVSVNEVRFNSGINSPNRINQEMVGEFRMVLSPVDAEMGRGAGQVQITTRSGTNAFHGSAVWNIQNTALDANEWLNKHRRIVAAPPWRNHNNYTLSLSGPIVQDKTFFFVTWDHQISILKQNITQTVLTPCARKGIYRYLDGMMHTNASLSDPTIAFRDVTSGGISTRLYNVTRPSVDLQGKPLETYTFDALPQLNPTIPNETTQGNWKDYSYDAGGLPEQYLGPRGPRYSGATVTNRLVYNSVIGDLSPADRIALGGIGNSQYANAGSAVYGNCDGYSISPGTAGYSHGWDVYRNKVDSSGFVGRFVDMMPEPNDWTGGNGLNTASLRWTRRVDGVDTVYGTGDANRRSITTKIDHNVNSQHRLSGTYTYEVARSNDDGVRRTWPDGWHGTIDRTPQTFTVSLTSTLRPTLLNELRVGLSRTSTFASEAKDAAAFGSEVQKTLRELLPSDSWPRYNDLVIATPGGNFPGSYGHFYGSAYSPTWGGYDPRWTVVDNITWMKGAHSFKGGIEFRRSQSYQKNAGTNGFVATMMGIVPMVGGGVLTARSPYGTGASFTAGPLTGQYGDAWEGLSRWETNDYTGRGTGSVSTKLSPAYDLLTYLSGSVANIRQFFFTTDSKNPRWNRPEDGEMWNIIDFRQNEVHLFFKDDWRITNNLTLNLGARWEYYGVPWEDTGRTVGVRNDIAGMYGISRNLGTWMADWDTLKNFSADYNANGTQQIFLGPNSGNPDSMVYNRDLNNFAPHVGFAWQLPWFGRGKTTLRGGYSISYSSIGNFTSYREALYDQPGTTYVQTYNGQDYCLSPLERECYMDFSNVGNLLPLDISITGLLPVGHPDRQVSNQFPLGGLTIYDPNVRNPYIQNVNLSVTRSLNSFLTLDVRYIGTLQRKGIGTLNLNQTNYFNNGLFDEFAKLRAGTADMNSMVDFPILNSGIIPYKGDPNGQSTASLFASSPSLLSGLPQVFNDSLSGAEQVLFNYWNDISRGNFQGIASSLRTADFHNLLTGTLDPVTGQPLRPVRPPNEGAGQVLRAGNAPDNLIIANTQYSGANIRRNQGRSNYHSMQTQVTMRPWYGLNLQATWTWSRNLTRGSVMDYRDNSPRAWETTYGLSGQHRTHTFNSYGSYELPFGARGLFFRDASGAFKKAVEGWQLSWIAQLQTGTGMSLTGISTVWGTNYPNQVGPFDTKAVGIKWHDIWDPDYSKPRAEGTYFNKEYMWVPDPQCLTAGIVNQNATNIYSTSNTFMSATCSDNPTSMASALNALAEVDGYDAEGRQIPGRIVFQNSLPGQIGNRNGNNIIYGPGSWSLDMTMAKSFEFMEGKRFEFRLDAQNIFNHASPSFGGQDPTYYGARVTGVANPNAALNDIWGYNYPFGYVNGKAGHRTFQGRLRLSF